MSRLTRFKPVMMIGMLVMLIATPVIWASEGEVDYSQHGDNWPTTGHPNCDGPGLPQHAQQSPVNIHNVYHANLHDLGFSYPTLSYEIENNGHSLEVKYASNASPPNQFHVGHHTTYTLDNIHFHSDSEHTRNGTRAKMEIHFVHKTPALAVVAVLVDIGAHNPALAQIINPNVSGLLGTSGSKLTTLRFNAASLLPPEHAYHGDDDDSHMYRPYYTYHGSLTTPECDEGVTWYVMKDHITMSQAQYDQLRTDVAVMNGNYRNTQPLNGRHVQFHDHTVPDDD
jgi:carbonic anhydrase